MIDLAVGITAVLALIGLAAIVVHKFPTLASIDTKTIPAERHGELKARLIEERFRRKLERASGNLSTRLKPVGGAVKRNLKTWYHRLLDLEQRYRTRVTSAELQDPAERAKKLEQVGQTVGSASEALSRGNLEAAEQKAIQAISLQPRSVEAYRVLAQVYIEQRDFEHARETLRFLIDSLHVEDDEVYAELGQVASGEGNLEEAKADLETSIRLNGQAAVHYLDLCRIELELGDSVAAFESCRKAVELEPNNPKFLDALVDASIVAGKRDWASETLEKLQHVNPENQKLEELSARVEAMSGSKRTPA